MGSATEVHRPVVRSFKAAYAREAAAHVRAGGHAVVWETPDRARLVVQPPARNDQTDLGRWSMLDLGRWRFSRFTSGPLRGLAFILVPKDDLWILRARVARDSVHRGPTRRVRFDCLECGACCRDNEVVVGRIDVRRFERAGLGHLAKKPYAHRKRDGKLVLLLRQDGRCQHLGRDLKCGVYAARPDACSQFPVASECCLYSREEVLGVIDGDKAGALVGAKE